MSHRRYSSLHKGTPWRNDVRRVVTADVIERVRAAAEGHAFGRIADTMLRWMEKGLGLAGGRSIQPRSRVTLGFSTRCDGMDDDTLGAEHEPPSCQFPLWFPVIDMLEVYVSALKGLALGSRRTTNDPRIYV